MTESEIKIKLSYITGLEPVVFEELEQFGFQALDEIEDSVYIEFSAEIVPKVKRMRSIARAYIVLQGERYHPAYISNHKSILGSLIDIVVGTDKRQRDFRTFKISCAGSESPEVRRISRYVQETYGLEENEEADLKIHIIKIDDMWEIGIQVTPRPLSVRDYRAINMSGAMDSTIAYAVNSLGNVGTSASYLNIFSGSATLLIEAGQCYPNLRKLIGFDNNKEHLSYAIKNIKKAGLIKRIQVKEADIFDGPDLGKFDAIASDLPFGMSISKNEDLERLYKAFIKYCEEALEPNGKLVLYTSEYRLIEPIVSKSRLKIIRSLQLKFITSVGAYLKPKILVCKFKAR